MNDKINDKIVNISQKILKTIQETRKQKKISRRKIADDLGFAPSTYADMEIGRTAFPLPRLLAVMEYLEIPSFFDFEPPSQEIAQAEIQPEHGIEQFWKKLVQQPDDIQILKQENTEIKALLHEILRRLDSANL